VVSSKRRILVAAHEAEVAGALSNELRAMGHEVHAAATGRAALEVLAEGVDMVLLAHSLPDMEPADLCRAVRDASGLGHVPVLSLLPCDNGSHCGLALRTGADDCLRLPVDPAEVRLRVSSLLRMRCLQEEAVRGRCELEDLVAVRSQALELAVDNLNSLQKGAISAHLETIHCLASAAEFRDSDTSQHIRRMSHYSMLLARLTGMPDGEADLVLQASPMHDVGKIGIPDAVLLKPESLSEQEWRVMKEHTLIGYDILSGSSSELLELGSIIALSHHERWDGTGYPRGLCGEAIPLFGRISAIADVFDALTSRRPYKGALRVEDALEIMQAGRGTHFDPTLLDAFIQGMDQVLEIKATFTDDE
jgi:putative two-component system response regulator